MIKDNFSIFGLPIFKSKIDKNDYNKDNIISIITENYQKNNYRNQYDSDSDLHHSYKDENNRFFKEINFDKLKKFCKFKVWFVKIYGCLIIDLGVKTTQIQN